MSSLLNGIMKAYLRKRFKRIEGIRRQSIQLQEAIRQRLLKRSKKTVFGRTYQFDTIRSAKEFASVVPIQEYEETIGEIQKMMNGKADVLWPGQVKWFAKSSGTSSNQCKFIPVSKEMLRYNIVPSGWDALSVYYNQRPGAYLFDSKSLIYGGSTDNYLQDPPIKLGDVSAIMIEHIPKVAKPYCVPEESIALESDWETKLDLMARTTLHENVTMMSGVPTWNVVLFKRLLTISGSEHMHEVWPHLQLYIHGGVSFQPYQDQFNDYLPLPMDYLEVYNASEGYFGLQDRLGQEDMLLLTDNGVYYEFLPLSEVGAQKPITLTLKDIELNQPYSLVISTYAGLWRYVIGDTIMFTSRSPYRFRICGRIRQYINVFGEELVISNAEQAITRACQLSNASICDFTVGPIYLNHKQKGGHEWLIEFERSPHSMDRFVKELDAQLCKVNHDYAAKRYKDLALERPKVHPVPRGSFYTWMKTKGKLGGQHKVPRLSNNRKYLEEILDFLHKSCFIVSQSN